MKSDLIDRTKIFYGRSIDEAHHKLESFLYEGVKAVSISSGTLDNHHRYDNIYIILIYRG